MAITDVSAFAHLTDADVENLANELDAIRREIEESRGERDASYIRRTIAAQRILEVTARVILTTSSRRSAWWVGTVAQSVAKIIENMEIGHNVMHGQWDWMNDPEIHSSTWEWDNVGAANHWRYTHNFIHHKYANILGVDNDLGFSLLRLTRDQRWRPFNLGNAVCNTILALGFEWEVGLQHLEVGRIHRGKANRAATRKLLREVGCKAGQQVFKDYVAFRAVTSLSRGATFSSTLKANAMANVIRNVWAKAVIFCGHFPDGAEKFTTTDLVGETKGEWYLRQMLGSANFDNGPVLRIMSGNLSVTRSSTICTRTCRATGSMRSRSGYGNCATSTTCPTPRARSRCSTPKPDARSSSCRYRTSTFMTAPMTLQRHTASGCSANRNQVRGRGGSRHRSWARAQVRDHSRPPTPFALDDPLLTG